MRTPHGRGNRAGGATLARRGGSGGGNGGVGPGDDSSDNGGTTHGRSGYADDGVIAFHDRGTLLSHVFFEAKR
ncbi:hypothetical protein ACAG25_13810 [Mycobacterium sp. pV006]|uniref:hypothetical protein n=1 Tax=Mycobacterium sp. pV006 TaxID=3238983 RepID=UPI00351AB3C4